MTPGVTPAKPLQTNQTCLTSWSSLVFSPLWVSSMIISGFVGIFFWVFSFIILLLPQTVWAGNIPPLWMSDRFSSFTRITACLLEIYSLWHSRQVKGSQQQQTHTVTPSGCWVQTVRRRWKLMVLCRWKETFTARMRGSCSDF